MLLMGYHLFFTFKIYNKNYNFGYLNFKKLDIFMNPIPLLVKMIPPSILIIFHST